MRFTGAATVGLLTLCAGTTLSVARAQQLAGVIRPVVATIDASPGPLGHRPLEAARMPSHVAGHLADRLQALHDTSTANLEQPVAAFRTPPPAATTAELRLAESLRPVSQAALTPSATPPLSQPAPAPTPRRNPLADDRHSFGIANPLRGSR